MSEAKQVSQTDTSANSHPVYPDEAPKAGTDHVLMVRPVAFGFNAVAALSNAFQHAIERQEAQVVQTRAQEEFDAYVDLLTKQGVKVRVVEDTPEPWTPDSVFPNNWFSTHEDGTLVLYPMSEGRRGERKPLELQAIHEVVCPRRTLDLTHFESEGKFLEGTGSMVLDRKHRLAYACRSPRTHDEVLEEFCRVMNYTPVVFDAFDQAGTPIYHTNVVMCVANSAVIICLDAVKDKAQRDALVESFTKTNKIVVDLSFEQMASFAGNMLELIVEKNQSLLVMSATARGCLTTEQVRTLEEDAQCTLVVPSIPTIERVGGGSARCMLAELYLRP